MHDPAKSSFPCCSNQWQPAEGWLLSSILPESPCPACLQSTTALASFWRWAWASPLGRCSGAWVTKCVPWGLHPAALVKELLQPIWLSAARSQSGIFCASADVSIVAPAVYTSRCIGICILYKHSASVTANFKFACAGSACRPPRHRTCLHCRPAHAALAPSAA